MVWFCRLNLEENIKKRDALIRTPEKSILFLIIYNRNYLLQIIFSQNVAYHREVPAIIR